MNAKFHSIALTCALAASALAAQQLPRPGAAPPERAGAARAQTNAAAAGDYASDLAVVHAAQQQALDQARETLGRAESPAEQTALTTAIKQMEQAEKAPPRTRPGNCPPPSPRNRPPTKPS